MSQAAAGQGIDPLNRTSYTAISAALSVRDVTKTYEFYQKAFGFEGRGLMSGPDGTAMHAELTLRGSVLMLGPEMPSQNKVSAQTLGNTPVTLYIYVEDVDQVTDRAAKAGAQVLMPAADMFWGDRTSLVADPEGNKVMLATHTSEPTPEAMDAAMKQMMAQGAS